MSTIQILIPEATANDQARRVINNSQVAMQGSVNAHGFSLSCEITARCGNTTLAFLDPPATRQVELRHLDLSGAVKLTQLGFSLADFLAGVAIPCAPS